MKFSWDGTVFSTKNYFKSNGRSGPLCKEYTVTPKNTIQYKIALIFLFIICVIHHALFVDYDDLKSKYYIICLFASCIVFLIVSLSCTIEKESLLLVVPLTLQMTTTYILGYESSYSIPWQTLGDFMIVEVIMGHQIHYFLSVVTDSASKDKREADHVILFRNSRPPLKCLEMIYRDLQVIVDKSRWLQCFHGFLWPFFFYVWLKFLNCIYYNYFSNVITKDLGISIFINANNHKLGFQVFYKISFQVSADMCSVVYRFLLKFFKILYT